MNSYTKLKEQQQEEINNFPIFFAFSDKQFKEGLEKMGVQKEDICQTPFGGFIKKTDVKDLSKMFLKHAEEKEEAMKDDDYLLNAFYYELNNHEYCITYDIDDTLEAVGVTKEELKNSKRLRDILQLAIEKYMSCVQKW